jgi:hypothetical protein
LQEIPSCNHLATAERFIPTAQSPEQKINKLKLPSRQHRDLINHEDLAAPHAVETGQD